jgi:hypothetical protein
MKREKTKLFFKSKSEYLTKNVKKTQNYRGFFSTFSAFLLHKKAEGRFLHIFLEG